MDALKIKCLNSEIKVLKTAIENNETYLNRQLLELNAVRERLKNQKESLDAMYKESKTNELNELNRNLMESNCELSALFEQHLQLCADFLTFCLDIYNSDNKSYSEDVMVDVEYFLFNICLHVSTFLRLISNQECDKEINNNEKSQPEEKTGIDVSHLFPEKIELFLLLKNILCSIRRDFFKQLKKSDELSPNDFISTQAVYFENFTMKYRQKLLDMLTLWKKYKSPISPSQFTTAVQSFSEYVENFTKEIMQVDQLVIKPYTEKLYQLTDAIDSKLSISIKKLTEQLKIDQKNFHDTC